MCKSFYNSKLIRRLEGMNKVYDFFLFVGGAISVFLSWAFNGVSKDLLIVLVAVMILDIVLGVAKGVVIKSISSKVLSLGVTKKLLKWLLLGCISICECELCRFAGVRGNTHIFTTFFIGTYVLSELLSIVENANALGLDVPHWVKPLLLIVRKEKVDKMPSFVGAALAQYLKLDVKDEDINGKNEDNNLNEDGTVTEKEASGIEPALEENKSNEDRQS